jgi:hypothetical protein
MVYNQKYHHFDSFYNHKFGFHITGPRQDAFEAVFRLKPKVVKTLDFSVDVMKRIRQEIPDVFLIGRLFVHPQDFGQLSGGTAQVARQRGLDMAEKILREEVNRDIHHINGKPIFHAWESLNEVFPEWENPEVQKLYDEYQIAFGEKMLAEGFEPIAFNFGQGNGRGQQWLELYEGTLETYNYLGFHEYDWPEMDRLHNVGLNGPSEPENLVPSAGEGRGNDGMWRALRYRRVMNEGIRQKYGDKHMLVITECGMTQGVWGGEDIGPWAHEVTVSSDIPGGVVDSPLPLDDYWNSMLWYSSELMKDDYVMGACLFVTGAAGLQRWETFEHLGPFMDKLAAFQKEIDLDASPSLPVQPLEPERQPATAVTPPSTAGFEKTEIPDTPVEEPSMPVEVETPVESEPVPEPSVPEWEVKIERGSGLALLVGDIGVANETVTITLPGGRVERVNSGSKAEHGKGGFEIYAHESGIYKVEFLGQAFEVSMKGQFTKVIFSKPD